MENDSESDDYEVNRRKMNDGLLLNKVPIHKRLKPETKKSTKIRKDICILPDLPCTPEPEFTFTDNSQSNEYESAVQLKEPNEKITLIERAVGYFNAETDGGAAKNPLNTSTNEGPPYICVICKTWFYLGPKLKVHYILNHSCYHCEVCSCLFETYEEKQTHLTKFHSTLFCEICQTYISNFYTLLQHYEFEHDSTTCKFCGILLQPKSLFTSHVVRKHCVNPKYLENAYPKFFETSDNETEFFCALCDKSRETEVFFGHIHSYHKVSVTSFMNMLVKENMNMKIKGTVMANSSSKVDKSILMRDYKPSRNSCSICLVRITKKHPSGFHWVYCHSNILCKHCFKKFTNTAVREKHIEKEHNKFSCGIGCDQLSYNSEEGLNKHYLKFHELVPCRYCDELITFENEKYQTHLEQNHKYKAVMMKNFMDTLFEVTESGEKHIVVCCLCDENISLLVENSKDIVAHYTVIHSVSLTRLQQLATPKPLLKEYEDFYKEINDSIKKESVESDDDQPEDLSMRTNQERDTPHSPDLVIKHETVYIKNEPGVTNETGVITETEAVRTQALRNEAPVEEEELTSTEARVSKRSIPKIKIKLEPEESASEEEEEKSKKVSYTESDIESDFDPEDLEGVINSDSDAELPDSNTSEDHSHICEFCGEEFTRLLDLISDLNEKHKLKSKYKEKKCQYCQEKFTSEGAYGKHLELHQEKNDGDFSEEMFNCGCDKKVVNSLARRHILEMHLPDLNMYNVNEVGLKCRFCEMRCWRKQELNEHEVSMHFEQNRNHFQKCYKCLTAFSSQKCLTDHASKHHKDSALYSKLSYKCLLCTVAYPNIELVREHFKTEHPKSKVYRCPVPNCYRTCRMTKYMMKHLKAPHNDKEKKKQAVTCDICGKVFKTVRAASIHMLMKHKRDRAGYQCRICQERYQTNEERKLHYTTAHPGQLAYTCLECGKGFISKSGLYGHRKVHQESPINICPYCKKEFSRRDSYNEHLLIHIGPRHQCPHCPKSFTQRSNLTRHVRIHTGAKPYQCMYCDKRFSDRGACRSHERVHTKEEHCECSYCGKKFTKWQKLKYHVKFHTGEGLVQCEVCSKQFSNTYSLNEHRRIHNQQTLVMCSCGRGFTSEKYLQRHMANVHNQGIAKYMCPICFKQIIHKSAYKDHIMTHTSVKHVRCLICNTEYNTRKTVRRHLVEKHNVTRDDFKKYIYQLTPQEAGLNLPPTPEIVVNVNDDVDVNELLEDRDMLKIDFLQFRALSKKTPGAPQTRVVPNRPKSAMDVKIKEEPLTEDEEDPDEPFEEENLDDVPLLTRAKRKDKIPVKRKRVEAEEQSSTSNSEQLNVTFDDSSDDSA